MAQIKNLIGAKRDDDDEMFKMHGSTLKIDA
jgi:hypothetical protein